MGVASLINIDQFLVSHQRGLSAPNWCFSNCDSPPSQEKIRLRSQENMLLPRISTHHDDPAPLLSDTVFNVDVKYMEYTCGVCIICDPPTALDI